MMPYTRSGEALMSAEAVTTCVRLDLSGISEFEAIPACRQLAPRCAPDELAGGALRQRHFGFELRPFECQFHADFAARVWDRSCGMRQLPKKRPNRQATEARRPRIDAEHRPEQLVVRAGAPGMAVGPRRVFLLGPRGEAPLQHGAPRTQQIQVMIAGSGFVQGRMQIVPEIDRTLHQ